MWHRKASTGKFINIAFTTQSVVIQDLLFPAHATLAFIQKKKKKN